VEARTGIIFALVPSIVINGMVEAASPSGEGVLELNGFLGMNGWLSPGPVLLSSPIAGEAVLVWGEGTDSTSRICAMKVNRFGELMWDSTCLELCGGFGVKSCIRAVGDCCGGFVAGWLESYGYGWRIKIEKVDRGGESVWPQGAVTVCSTLVDPEDFQMTSDGAGGAFVTWRMREGQSSGVFVRRVTATGKLIPENGAARVTSPGTCVFNPQIAPCSSGGATISWMQSTGNGWDLFAQMVDSSCMIQWGLNGVPLCRAEGDQGRQVIVGDGAGGAVVAWMDERSGGWDVYAQRVDCKGRCVWSVNGVPITSSGFDEGYPLLETDGGDRVFVSWLSARRLDEAGEGPAEDGMEIVIPVPYYRRRIIGGAVGPEIRAAESCIEDFLSASCMDGEEGLVVCLNKLDSSGHTEWSDGGVVLGDADGTAWYVDVVSDEEGGVFSVWTVRKGDETAVAAAHTGTQGDVKFFRKDLAYGCPAGYLSHSRLAADGAGGVFFSWLDWSGGRVLVFLGRMGRAGEFSFEQRVGYRVSVTEETVEVDWSVGKPAKAGEIVVERTEGAGCAFQRLDLRTEERFPGSYSLFDTTVAPGGKYIYRVKLSSGGRAITLFQTDTVEVPIGSTRLYPCYPNPFNCTLRVPYFLSRDGTVSVEVFDVLGRRIRVLAKRRERRGRHEILWDGANEEGRDVSSGVYFVRLKTGESEAHRKVVLVR